MTTYRTIIESMPSAVGPAMLLILSALLPAEDAGHRMTHDCRWRDKPMVIDGKPTEAAWADAQWISTFWGLAADAPQTTQSKASLLWDEQGLYFAAILQDADQFARVTKHDGNTWEDDVFELFLMAKGGFSDPKRKGKPYYEFEINALNTTFDLLFDGTGDLTSDYITGLGREQFQWKTAVHLMGTLNDASDRDTSWSVEGFIPWSDFAQTGGRPLADDAWTGIFARYDYPSSAKDPLISASAPMTAKGFHDPVRWMSIRFCAPAKASPAP